jgi:hypothetical protein
MAAILERVTNQHCRYRKQTEQRKPVHRIAAKRRMICREEKLAFTIAFRRSTINAMVKVCQRSEPP